MFFHQEYRNRGIGKELVRRCIAHFPDSEWLVQTEKHFAGYYEKMGFKFANRKDTGVCFILTEAIRRVT